MKSGSVTLSRCETSTMTKWLRTIYLCVTIVHAFTVDDPDSRLRRKWQRAYCCHRCCTRVERRRQNETSNRARAEWRVRYRMQMHIIHVYVNMYVVGSHYLSAQRAIFFRRDATRRRRRRKCLEGRDRSIPLERLVVPFRTTTLLSARLSARKLCGISGPREIASRWWCTVAPRVNIARDVYLVYAYTYIHTDTCTRTYTL